MTLTITTENVGTRIYVTGNTYQVKDRLRAAGCHWDGERKQWWIGAAKAADIQGIVSGLDGQEAPKEDLSSKRLHGKVEYKGRSYYVLGYSARVQRDAVRGDSVEGGRLRLTVLDGSIDFWAAESACKWTKRYEVRTRFGGYGRGQVEVYATLASIRRFIAEQKNPETSRGRCTECDAWGPVGQTCRECHEGTHC